MVNDSQKSKQILMRVGGGVVNVYGSKDLIIQKFLGSGLGVFTLNFAKRTMENATNIQINQGVELLEQNKMDLHIVFIQNKIGKTILIQC